MSVLIASQKDLLKYVPNVVYSVENEDDLYQKVLPYMDTEEELLAIRVLGMYPDSYKFSNLRKSAKNAMAKAVVCRAMAKAMPAIDVVVTPNGIGVVSTAEIAPASKERVERLIKSMWTAGAQSLALLVNLLKEDKEWVESYTGNYFCSTLASSIEYAMPWADRMTDILDVYGRVRNLAMVYESRMADSYVGIDTMARIVRSKTVGASDFEDIFSLLEFAEQRFISQCWDSDNILDRHFMDLWRTGQQVVDRIAKNKDLAEGWAKEKPEVANPAPDTNSMRGTFFF